MKLAVYGYGNLGKGVECAAAKAPDAELCGIFSRRDPSAVKPHGDVPVYPSSRIGEFRDAIDVLIICGGSATDLPGMTPALAADFNVLDSFDTHASIPEHFARVNEAAEKSGHIALISAGWDPGMFSLNRLYANAILPDGADYTFWGRGVSQGHSDAIRRVRGVKDARQYTVPVPEALERVRAGENPVLSAREKHTRECYVVLEEGADPVRVEREIKEMPHYFDEYDTTVNFISEEELLRDHRGIPHGGQVIRTGTTGWDNENRHVIEYSLKLDSNPEFTASILVAFARAIFKMRGRGVTGCKTVFDVAPADLSPLSPEELQAKLL